ncbi:MAG: glutathione S-transferase family protein, partial [Myxococcales bacterium]|nr:glutathione S-transferase family protein [Myxococcales bacterium]
SVMTQLTLYYAPRTRSFTALWLLEELGVDYELMSVDLAAGVHKSPEYLALNPMGKVPLVVDRGRPVSELGAIAIYLADLYPQSGLCPSLDDPQRPAYLRWIFFASAIIEPAYAQKFFKWEIKPSQAAWGSFDQMLSVLNQGVPESGYLLGEHFSAADVVVGAGARFGLMFGALPKEGAIANYVARLTERDAFKRASEIEARESARFPAQG